MKRRNILSTGSPLRKRCKNHTVDDPFLLIQNKPSCCDAQAHGAGGDIIVSRVSAFTTPQRLRKTVEQFPDVTIVGNPNSANTPISIPKEKTNIEKDSGRESPVRKEKGYNEQFRNLQLWTPNNKQVLSSESKKLESVNSLESGYFRTPSYKSNRPFIPNQKENSNRKSSKIFIEDLQSKDKAVFDTVNQKSKKIKIESDVKEETILSPLRLM